MKRTVVVATFLLCAHISYAQKQKVRKVSFTSINQIGVVTGAQKDAAIIQTINGVAIKKWSLGLGVGIDTYSERSVPVFLDVRKSLGNANNVPFLYVDGGMSFPWLNFIQTEEQSFPEHNKTSWYYDAGIGWKIPLSDKNAFLISAGYTMKQYNGSRIAYGPFTGGPAIEYREPFENIYRRISIKIGVQF